MFKIKSHVNLEVANYMKLLSCSVDAASNLISSIKNTLPEGTENKLLHAQEKFFVRYRTAFNIGKKKLQSIIPLDLQDTDTFWDLNMNTGEFTVTINNELLVNLYIDNPSLNVENWDKDASFVIDENISKELYDMYNITIFDNEFGLNEKMISHKRYMRNQIELSKSE